MDRPIPMGRENPDDDFAIGYMCLTDFECEIGMALGGNTIYPSVEDCRKNRRCTDACGIVEVEVRARRVVQESKEEWDMECDIATATAQSPTE